MSDTEAETLTVSVEPDAALTIINDTEWERGDMDRLRALATAVKHDRDLSWEVPKDAE